MEKIDGIAEALNTTFKTADIPKAIEKLDSKVIQAKTINANEYATLEDKDYLKLELFDLISSMQATKRILEENLVKPGIKSSEIEAIAVFSEKILTAIKELRILNMDVINTNLAQKRLDQSYQIKTGNITNNVQNNVYMLDSKSLDEMIKNAENNRRIDSIDVDFEIDDQIK